MSLPPIGFGTSPYRTGEAPLDREESVRSALQAGYRLFDLAEGYGNERAIARAFRSLDAPPRRELFLVGKLWRTNFHPERVRKACEASIRRLQIEAFDLYLLHAPGALRFIAPLEDAEEIGWDELVRRATPRDQSGEMLEDPIPLVDTWEAMKELVLAGLTARIGVSNFTLEEIDQLGTTEPAANQIACWPFDSALVEAHCRRGITLLGYSPLKREVLEAPLTRSIASAHRRTPAQVALRWLMNRGLRPLTSSTNPAHIRESLGALDLDLQPAEMNALGSDRHRL